MSFSKVVLAALGVAVFSGCVATNAAPPDRRVTIAEDIGTDVYVTDIRCVKGAGGYTTLQANVVNNTSGDYGVEWKVVWLDPQGVAYDTLVSSWNRLMLAPRDVTALKNTSPRTDAADMMLYIRRLR